MSLFTEKSRVSIVQLKYLHRQFLLRYYRLHIRLKRRPVYLWNKRLNELLPITKVVSAFASIERPVFSRPLEPTGITLRLPTSLVAFYQILASPNEADLLDVELGLEPRNASAGHQKSRNFRTSRWCRRLRNEIHYRGPRLWKRPCLYTALI